MRSTQGDRSLRLSSVVLAPFLFFFGALATMRTAARQRPDVIHAHWVLPNGFLAALAARLLTFHWWCRCPVPMCFVSGMNPLFLHMARFAFAQAAAITTNSTDLLEAATALGARPAQDEAHHLWRRP